MAGLLTEKIRESQKRKGLLDLWSGLLGDAADTASKAESKLYDRSLIYKSLKDAVTAPGRAYKGELDPWSQEAIPEAMNVAGMATLGGFPGGARGPGSVGATVWHGSPHKFDKFDMSKIGTGEGAQAYGHGLYMAEAPDVARTYSADRAYVGAAMSGKPSGINYDDPAWIAQKTIDELGTPEAAATHLQMVQRTAAKHQSKETAEAVKGAIEMITTGAIKPKGVLYKVDIPDESVARMLDWDKPLSEQAPEVQKAVSGLVNDPQAILSARKEVFAKYDAGLITKEQLNAALSDARAGVSQQELGQSLYMRLGNQQKATDALRSAGVPGIKYLDGFSRGPQGGSGTNNYVLFNDQLPRILERNGEPTGLQPWAPGEANSLLGLPPAAPTRPRNALGQEIPGLYPWAVPLSDGLLGSLSLLPSDAEAR